MKTLAELKRVAKTGTLEGKMIIRCGKPVDDNLPERLKGWRKIVDSNSVAIFFQNVDGGKSELRIDNAALTEFTGTSIILYNAGERELNETEKRAMDEWKAITKTKEYKNNAYYDAFTDCITTYYQEKHFFENKGLGYLQGCGFEKGCKYNCNTGKIIDKHIKGTINMQYELRIIGE